MVPDQKARDQARRELGRNIVVEAGAGTGKTTLLTDRILFLLIAGGPKKQGLPLTEIVALTFTDKAAAEIQTRLAGRLEDLLRVLDGQALTGPDAVKRQEWTGGVLAELKAVFKKSESHIRQSAEKALHEMDRAEIGTIHSFASRILRLYPVQAGVDPAFKIDKTEEYFEELFEAEWALWLDSELGPEPGRAAKWLEILPLATLSDIADLARALCREEAGEAELGSGPETVESFRKLARSFTELGKIRVSPGSSRILEAVGTVSAHLQALSDSLDKPPALPRSWMRNDFKSERAKDWPKNWRSVEGQEVYADGARLAAEVSAESEALVRKTAELVRPFAERFRALYIHRGFISFDGLLVRARNLVRGNADARRALKERFRALLIDEFQDTDPLQGELLLYLAEQPSSFAEDWRDASFRLEDGKILVVGDPKQSIYRFRGADMRAYEMFTRRLLEQGALKCDLQTNFRSHAGLVEPVNAVFAGIMREEPGLQPRYMPLHPRPEKDGEGAKDGGLHWVLTPGREDGLKAGEAQKLEAAWIADWILEHCVARQDLKLKDVAVLFRSTSPLATYLDAFKERGIRYVVESDRYFYGAQEVIDLVNLLRVVENPSDGISMLGLLRSPLAGLDDAEVYSLYESGVPDYRRDPPATARLSEEGKLRLAGVWELLRKLRAAVGREPLSEFIDRLLRDSLFLELSSVAYHEEQTVSNLMKFRRLAAEATEARGATLKEFIGSVVRSMDESAKEGESPLADEWLPAVRILTVHKAKGLEYPVVFLPNLSGVPGGHEREETLRVDWESGRAGLRLPKAKAADLAMAMIDRAEREREAREYVRLLYVAATRAKEALFLLGRAQAKDDDSFASLLLRAGAWPDAEGSTWTFGGRTFPVTRLEIQPAEIARPKPAQGAPRVLPLKEMKALWSGRLAPRPGKPLFIRPTEDQDKPLAGAEAPPPRAAKGIGAHLGDVCHKVLEDWDFRAGGDPGPAVDAACAALSRKHPLADWEAIAREARAVLKGFFGSAAAAGLRDAEILGREVPFVYPVEEGGGRGVMRGSIDVVFRKDGALWAADYKTGRTTEARAAEFSAQGRAYRRAVELALGEPCGFQLIFLRDGRTVTEETIA